MTTTTTTTNFLGCDSIEIDIVVHKDATSPSLFLPPSVSTSFPLCFPVQVFVLFFVPFPVVFVALRAVNLIWFLVKFFLHSKYGCLAFSSCSFPFLLFQSWSVCSSFSWKTFLSSQPNSFFFFSSSLASSSMVHSLYSKLSFCSYNILSKSLCCF